ncbi:probable carboxylesterase 18 [Miscanthus floridulus]|uniref:probable carboxylesterase 18 n=1 Tax=Miscanthus floridulus TaxID=154761 RepID=UPI00345A4EF5
MEAAGAGPGEGAPSAPRRSSLPWKVRSQLLCLNVVAGFSMRRDGTINHPFFSFFARRARASARPYMHGVRSTDVDASRGLWARVFSPSEAASASPLPVVVYFHSGAFALFSAASVPYDAMCRRFCRELGAVVVSVDYHLAPEHRCPAAYEDGVDVLRHLASAGLPDGVAVPVDLSCCFLVGDCAGANIAHHVAQRWMMAGVASSSPPRSNPFRLAGVVLVQPYLGGEERIDAEARLDGKVPVVTMRGSNWMRSKPLDVGQNNLA